MSLLKALRGVRDLSGTFGSPSTLKQRIASDGGYLLTKAPPAELYGHIVWLAMQVHNTAGKFHHTFTSLKDVIGPAAGAKAQRAANLKDILLGRAGLVSSAEEMQKKTAALIARLSQFDGSLSEANLQVQRYTDRESEILAHVNAIVQSYTDKITSLQTKSEEALKKWEQYSYAAAFSSVGLFFAGLFLIILAPATWGWSAVAGGALMAGGVAAAGGLGAAAEKQLKIHEQLQRDIAQAKREQRQKIALKLDLGSLNDRVKQVGPALTDVIANLKTIEGVWVDTQVMFKAIIKDKWGRRIRMVSETGQRLGVSAPGIDEAVSTVLGVLLNLGGDYDNIAKTLRAARKRDFNAPWSATEEMNIRNAETAWRELEKYASEQFGLDEPRESQPRN